MASSSVDPEMSRGYKQPWFQLDADSATNGPLDMKIVGEIPEWVKGSLFRNGPGIFRIGESNLEHLFDGFAVLHRFDVRDGTVTYTSRVLDTETWERSVKANRLVSTQFGTYAYPDPCKKIFCRWMTYFKPGQDDITDNTSVNIVEHGDRLYTLTETPLMLEVDPHSLQKVQTENPERVVAVHLSTAHPHFDSDGNMYNLGTAFNPSKYNYNIVKVPSHETSSDPVSSVSLQASLQSRWTYDISYNHSFGMSSDHFVILEQPITMSSFKFLVNNWRRSAMYDNFTKHPEEEFIFRVVRRGDGQEVGIRYRAEPAFTFHFVNCFEQNGELVVDFIGYSDLTIIDSLYVSRLDENAVASAMPGFRRYVLPLSIDQATVDQNLVKLPETAATAVLRTDGTVFLTPDFITKNQTVMELPRTNYAMVNGKQYRYVYGTSIFTEKPQLKKLDLEEKKELTWGEEGYQPGEPVFVPRPGANDEDDGVVLSPMVSMQENKSCFLVVLEAHSFTELARAIAPSSMKWALTFHGTFRHDK